MPTYVFGKESFLKFLEGHLDEETVIVVSSDITNFNKRRVESYTGEGDYYFVEFGIPDIFELNEDEVDELMKYAIIFIDKDELNEEGKKQLRP